MLNICLDYQVKPTVFPGSCFLFILRKRKSKRDCEVKVGQKTMFSCILGLLKWFEKVAKICWIYLIAMKDTHLSLFVFCPFLFPSRKFREWALSSESKVDQADFLYWMFLSSNLMDEISPNPKTLNANTWNLSTVWNGWNDQWI